MVVDRDLVVYAILDDEIIAVAFDRSQFGRCHVNKLDGVDIASC